MSNNDYAIALKDINGITVNSVTKKINDGDWISLNAKDISFSYKPYANPASPPNVRMKSGALWSRNNVSGTETLTSRLGPVVFAGMENPIIVVNGVIDLNKMGNVFNTSDGTRIRELTVGLLYYIATIPNVYYIRDYFGTGTANTFIGSLQNTDDWYSKWDTPKNIYLDRGMPVKIKSVTGIKRDSTSSEKGHILPYTITFTEVKDPLD